MNLFNGGYPMKDDHIDPDAIGPQQNEVFTTGRRGCLACLTVTEWPDGLVHVCGEEEHITQRQLVAWVGRHYGGVNPVWKDFGRGYVGVQFRAVKEGESCQK